MVTLEGALKTAAQAIRQVHPELSAESIIIFLCVAGNELGSELTIDVPRLAAEVGLQESILQTHLLQLAITSGGGLVRILDPQDARRIVLTPQGKSIAKAVEKLLH